MVDERKRLLPPRLDDQEVEPPFTCCLPRVNNRTVGKTSILITLALERIAFYSLSGNLVLFLNGTSYSWTSYQAVNASYVFLGISYMSVFLGGILADIKLGRFKVIFLAFIIYLIGYVFFPVISQRDVMNTIMNKTEGFCDPKTNSKDGNTESGTPCNALIYTALVVVGIGTGIFKANIAPFGADQLKGQDARSTNVFFNWYYWSINVGTLVALGGIAYLQQSVTDHGFFIGYLVAISCLLAGMIVFLFGKCAYVYRKPMGSYFINMFKIIREAWRIRKRKKAQYEHRLNLSSSAREVSQDAVDRPRPVSFLDHAKFRFGGSYHDHSVDDIKKVGKILLVFTALIPYWMVYYQLETTFLMQGLHMKLSFINNSYIEYGSNGTHPDKSYDEFSIAVAWLTLFDVVILIVLIPIMDRIIYPWIRRKGWNFTMVKRMTIGLVFSLLAILLAGLIEHERLRHYWVDEEDYGSPGNCNYTQIQQNIQDTVYNASTMSVLWQIPQCCLIGLSEIFTSIAGLEFASLLAPKAMKSSVMGLFYFFSGLGSFASLALLAIFYKIWFWPSVDLGNINCRKGCADGRGNVSEGTCHLDYYFYLLGGIQALGALLFIFLSWKLNLQKEIKLGLANNAHIQNTTVDRRSSASSDQSAYRYRSPRLGRPGSASISRPSSVTTETEIHPPPADDTSAAEDRVSELPRQQTVERTIQKDRTGRIGVAGPK